MVTTDTLSVLTWNLNGEVGVSEARLRAQLDVLDRHADEIDVAAFQAVGYDTDGDDRGGHLGALLDHFEAADADYGYVHTADWARELYHSEVQPHQSIEAPHNRCHLTVSRWPIERDPLDLRGFDRPRRLTCYTTQFPEKVLASRVDLGATDGDAGDLDVWNVAAINGANWHEEKVKILETVYARLWVRTVREDRSAVLAGDFNAPGHEAADGTVTPHGSGVPAYHRSPFYGAPYFFGEGEDAPEEFGFDDRWRRAERQVFDDDVADWGLRDAYWAAPGEKRASDEAYTHEIPSGTRKRIDHVFASTDIGVERCRVLTDVLDGDGDGPAPSDHAPVIADLRL